ncbi:MAG: hypothetical protein N838_23275 [Thiohalocapsa sp. PB-PSB1]|nr:MAG: hypothetical protein N838_23275 [Thiohalocapsa sp. PB-PSB1]
MMVDEPTAVGYRAGGRMGFSNEVPERWDN